MKLFLVYYILAVCLDFWFALVGLFGLFFYCIFPSS